MVVVGSHAGVGSRVIVAYAANEQVTAPEQRVLLRAERDTRRYNYTIYTHIYINKSCIFVKTTLLDFSNNVHRILILFTEF